MPRRYYSEDILIQQPTAELLERDLKWDSVFAYGTHRRSISAEGNACQQEAPARRACV